MMHWYARLIIALTFLCFFCSTTVSAHTRSQSLSIWTIDGSRVTVTFNVTTYEATRLSAAEDYSHGLTTMLQAHLNRTISVSSSDVVCSLSKPFTPVPARKGYQRLEALYICNDAQNLQFENTAFFQLAPSHTHFSRVQNQQGLLFDTILTRHNTLMTVRDVEQPAGFQKFTSFVSIGVAHIMTGYDHLVFLVGLLLLCRNFRSLAITISGFTIGHSLTLSMSSLGIFVPNIQLVEALIGFTILMVGIEVVGNEKGERKWLAAGLAILLVVLAGMGYFTGLQAGPLSLLGLALFGLSYLRLVDRIHNIDILRMGVTILFGLIHGFGFASALEGLDYRDDAIVLALFGFNVGVELGQLATVAALWFGGLWVTTRIDMARILPTTRTILASTLGALGTYWFIGRLLIS